ncbi:hypothetical protein C8T65DRAFT_696695 [Cerioporus squamosus]|nr:hypothetical protein C8T65DRAFT_696695 [Cerioporus squamosus]
MPVTFTVASHPATEWWGGYQPPTPEAVLAEACEPQYKNCKQVLQSSLKSEDLPRTVPMTNGFVHAVLEAWGFHMHLRIRPDDVWVAILNQLNFYINAHAEELRRYFVAHDGKKNLRVNDARWDFGMLARKMSLKIRENVVDSTLVEWILPDFTTTTLHDRAVCSIIMMATLKEYFTYSMGETCGIPSVTLEGERSDWVDIYRRLDRLYELGDEPSVWAEMLRPILRRFICAFDGDPDVKFWDTSPIDDLSGWLTAFCVWNNKGVWQPRVMPDVIPTKPPHDILVDNIPKGVAEASSQRERTGWKNIVKKIPGLRKSTKVPADVSKTAAHSPPEEEPSRGSVMTLESSRRHLLTLDGVSYFVISAEYVPAGYCEVDVTLFDNGSETFCTMIAGHYAASISSSTSGGKLDTLSPSPHWVIFEKLDSDHSHA